MTIARHLHATKAIDPSRAVRDISHISDEVISQFLASGASVVVRIDIESDNLDRLTPDQVTVLRENLTTLGFTDWAVE